jgi:hypothetical protein
MCSGGLLSVYVGIPNRQARPYQRMIEGIADAVAAHCRCLQVDELYSALLLVLLDETRKRGEAVDVEGFRGYRLVLI